MYLAKDFPIKTKTYEAENKQTVYAQPFQRGALQFYGRDQCQIQWKGSLAHPAEERTGGVRQDVGKEFESFGLPRKSQLSDSIWQNDRIRRDGLLGLFDLVKAHLYLRKGAQYEAASRLKQFMKDCRLSPRASINELSGMLTVFLDNLEEVHPAKSS